MGEDRDRMARLALSCVVEPGDLRLRTRLRQHTPEELWASVAGSSSVDASARRAAVLDLAPILAAADAVGARFLVPGDDEWPERVEDLDDALQALADIGGNALELDTGGIGAPGQLARPPLAGRAGRRAGVHRLGDQVE